MSSANPPVVPNNLSTTITEAEAQSGQQSSFYRTNAPFAARFASYRIDAMVNGAPVSFTDLEQANSALFGSAAAVWFKLQGADSTRRARSSLAAKARGATWRGSSISTA